MAFDAAARAKAIEVRKRNAEQRRLLKQNQEAATATTSISSSEPISLGVFPTRHIEMIAIDDIVPVFNWNDSPLGEVINKLAELKREYDMASQIVMQRQSREPVVYTCWTQAHLDTVAKATLAQCKKNVQDGKWAFIDNGAKDEEGKISPVVTCSMLCFMSYQSWRSKQKERQFARTQ